MKRTVETFTFHADGIISVDRRVPLQKALPFADSIFRKRAKKPEFCGAGLYATYFDDQLLYIGKFMGRRGDWKSGNVVEARWTKHIGTFTMRARDIGFSPRAFAEISRHVEASDGNDPLEFSNAFRQAKREVLCRETGCMGTYSRFRVASEIWKLTNGELDLSRFTFKYSKLDGELPTEAVRALVSDAEADVLGIYHPPGNSIARRVASILPSHVELSEIFESKLRSLPIISGKQSMKENYPAINKEPMHKEPEEEGSALRFEDETTGAPADIQELVESLKFAIAGIENADVEYTKVPDLRVRRLTNNRRGFINVATLQWQKRHERLLLKTLLNESELRQFGLKLDRRGSSVLAHETFIDIEFLRQHQEKVVDLILHAHNSERRC